MHSNSLSAQKFEGRWMRRTLAALVLLLLASSVSSPASATSLTPLPDCMEGTEGPALELIWQGLPDEDSLFRQLGWGLTLTLRNHTGRELRTFAGIEDHDDRGRYGRVCAQLGLDFFWVDAVATDLQHPIRPAQHSQIPLRVDHTSIAGQDDAAV